jgi:hypothetical protein
VLRTVVARRLVLRHARGAAGAQKKDARSVMLRLPGKSAA